MSPRPTLFLLHVPSASRFAGSQSNSGTPRPTVESLLLTVDTPKAEIMLRLPVGRCSHIADPGVVWDRWITRLCGSFVGRYQTTSFDRSILLNLVCLYHAFALRYGVARRADFYDAFTDGLVQIASGARGRCVKHELALYLINMRVLFPHPYLNDVTLGKPVAEPLPNPITRNGCFDSEGDSEPADLPMPSVPPSPSLIATAAEVADALAHDSGYDSCDSMPSLRTVSDSSDEDQYYSDSSEEPDADPEEEALLAEGFVVDEDVSDLDI